MLTNLARAGQPLVRLVLSGNCSLEERLASPRLGFLQFADHFAVLFGSLESERDGGISERENRYGRRKRLGNFFGRSLPKRSSSHRRRAAVDQPVVRSCLARGVFRRPAAIWKRRISRKPGPICSNCPRLGTAIAKADKPGVIEFGRLDDMPESEEAVRMHQNADADAADQFDLGRSRTSNRPIRTSKSTRSSR